MEKLLEEFTEMFGDVAPNPEHYPKAFEYYVKLFKYYKSLDNAED